MNLFEVEMFADHAIVKRNTDATYEELFAITEPRINDYERGKCAEKGEPFSQFELRRDDPLLPSMIAFINEDADSGKIKRPETVQEFADAIVREYITNSKHFYERGGKFVFV